MQGSGLILIVLPVVIPLALAIGVALPFAADSRAARTQSGRQVSHRAAQDRVDTRGPVAGAVIAVGVAQVLRGPTRVRETSAAQGAPLDRTA
jgi:hypothetical protein